MSALVFEGIVRTERERRIQNGVFVERGSGTGDRNSTLSNFNNLLDDLEVGYPDNLEES